MDKWKRKLEQLNEREKKLKCLYESGRKEMVESVLSYEQYCSCVEMGKCLDDEIGRYYRDKSKNLLGYTIDEVEVISKEEIDVVVHQRYSYPVMHNHAYVELIYVYSGSCIHFVETGSFEMKAGDICILAPNAMHAVSVSSDDVTVVNLMISKKLFDAAFLGMIRGDRLLVDFFQNVLYNKKVSPYIIFHTKQDALVRKIVLDMYREREEMLYAYKENLELYIKQLFIHLIRCYEMLAVVSDPIEAIQDDHIVAVLGYISVNYNWVSLKAVSDFFGYNDSYLSKLLKKHTGKTFSVIITELQMEHAGKLLEEGKLSITEICQCVGCFDSSHLNRKFNKFYGMSPDEYRKKKRSS